MFINDALAQGVSPVAAGTSLAGTIIQLVCVLLVFYLLLIRPQQKKMKQHEAVLKALKVGDNIVTGGGLYGKITKINGDDITVEISKGVEVKMHRYTIRDLYEPEVSVTTNSKKKSKK